MKNSIKREQSQACLHFAERKNFRLQAKKIKSLLAVLMVAGMMGACGPFIDNPIENVHIEGIKVVADQLKDDGTATILVGEEVQLKIALTPLHAVADIEFTSADELIATVSQSGLIKAVGPGTVNIYIRADNDPALFNVITITVVDAKMGIDDDEKVDQGEAEARRR